MTTQIKFTKEDQKMGLVEGLIRIKGKRVFFKFNNSDIAQNMVAKLQQGGAIITPGRKWIRVNMFGTHELVKLGGHEFNPQTKTNEAVEVILTEFYQIQYARAGFEINTSKIE